MPKLNREQKSLFNQLKRERLKKFNTIEKSIRKILNARSKIDIMEAAHQALVRQQEEIYAIRQSDAMKAGLPPAAIMFLENIKNTTKVRNEIESPPQPE